MERKEDRDGERGRKEEREKKKERDRGIDDDREKGMIWCYLHWVYYLSVIFYCKEASKITKF